jgi:hypothetical protein
MWWYRDRKDDEGAEAATPETRLARALAPAARGRPADPDLLMLMAVLVDGRVEMADGTVFDGMSWAEAEKVAAAAAGGGPHRLYNVFARDYGDGVTARADLTPEQSAAQTAARKALDDSPDVAAYRSR